MMKYQERLLTIIRSPIISEKSTGLADKHRTISFKVVQSATKSEVRDAVEKLFEVKVKSVGIANMKGKAVRVRGVRGQRAGWKKAYVSLQEGHDINLSELQ